MSWDSEDRGAQEGAGTAWLVLLLIGVALTLWGLVGCFQELSFSMDVVHTQGVIQTGVSYLPYDSDDPTGTYSYNADGRSYTGEIYDAIPQVGSTIDIDYRRSNPADHRFPGESDLGNSLLRLVIGLAIAAAGAVLLMRDNDFLHGDYS